MRLIKGMDSKDIEKKLADIQYHIWQINQQINVIQNTMSEKHYKRSLLEQQITGYNTAYLVIEKQIPVRENDRKKFEQLQTTIEQYKLAIENGDAQNQQEQTEMAQKQRALSNELSKIKEQLATIEKKLSEIEKSIVAEARVIGTTLCKVYMNSNLRERQFDVVIMDEVSMAPLPSLYIAASRANRSVVTIGDPRQLAPICISQNNSKVAEQWLGTDLFTHLDISFNDTEDNYSVLLKQQARMHPSISKISNKYVYEGLIQDSQIMDHTKYVGVGPLPGKQLILCDTSDASPVAISPGDHGRINMYHALCTIEITRQVLASLPPLEHNLHRGEFRIGLVTPYRKQAQLLQSLIKDAGLTAEVQARTVHKFQGLEAEVIIFDTVESPPIPPRHDFIAGTHGSNAMRLINVAVTRAKHKLIIVAHANHIKRVLQSKDILRLAVQDAQAGGVIKSHEILRNQFNTSQRRATNDSYPPGKIQFTREVDNLELYNEHTFYDRFLQDIHAATKSMVILSPFLGIIRAKSVAPTLANKIKDGVKVIVITSQLKEDDKTENARKQLERIGAEIRIQHKMHEKLIFIDERIVYYGSLNALSYIDNSNSELMIRSVLPHFVKQCWDFVKVDDKLHASKWSKKEPMAQKGMDIIFALKDLPDTSNCQQCGQKMVPRLESKTGRPFYGCTNFSHTNCKFTIDVTEDDVRSISILKNIVCESCGSTGTVKKIPNQGFWFECSNSSKCSYKNRITFTKQTNNMKY
ncbi:MAG TPA: AAA domain-containing protein [Ktedonobacteraceae bacterium]|nr:AAA domain-containing protein [Ktedonobacteraceae bacterium]